MDNLHWTMRSRRIVLRPGIAGRVYNINGPQFGHLRSVNLMNDLAVQRLKKSVCSADFPMAIDDVSCGDWTSGSSRGKLIGKWITGACSRIAIRQRKGRKGDRHVV